MTVAATRKPRKKKETAHPLRIDLISDAVRLHRTTARNSPEDLAKHKLRKEMRKDSVSDFTEVSLNSALEESTQSVREYPQRDRRGGEESIYGNFGDPLVRDYSPKKLRDPRKIISRLKISRKSVKSAQVPRPTSPIA
ncbi:hypothetical protein J7E62_04970 [Variovorax paradoxus]|nr:hypothetical protein [Variovorax paradoxus]